MGGHPRFCVQCGSGLRPGTRFCGECGHATAPAEVEAVLGPPGDYRTVQTVDPVPIYFRSDTPTPKSYRLHFPCGMPGAPF